MFLHYIIFNELWPKYKNVSGIRDSKEANLFILDLCGKTSVHPLLFVLEIRCTKYA